ncbi:trypsin-like serine protease [Aquincola sp. S2]|uniref:Trypsin-like serine protease n=1 Tax=Pseudaquabacterium terrae TaxID=2732868 RepID=A0ABX2EET8_9BURK|nr:trypsin-like serine protease [Aquabacterium terrae]NRF67142.1 trypsin-like serine protease [Aquabacterium terrae]
MKRKLLVQVTRVAAAVLPWMLGAFASGPAHAGLLPGASYTPLIVAGAPPDSPAARVDANLPTSPFSGVVSINIRYANGDSFICSGALVSKRDVVTAGHCVDSDGNGTVIDINAPGNDVRVVFNSQPNPGDPGRAIVTADKVSINPNYKGFGNCPPGVNSFCVNDDVAVVHMNADAPDTAAIYRMLNPDTVNNGQLITMVGYGTSGTGPDGFTVGPNFRIKRVGMNVMDLYDLDDEQGFVAGPQEVWYADFDGNGLDVFCDFFGTCTQVLPNDKEAGLGGGDSGGPSFVFMDGEYFLYANNTFGGTLFDGQIAGSFGTFSGGIVLASYADYLEQVTNGAIQIIPEPGSLALVGVAAAALLGARRRKRAG